VDFPLYPQREPDRFRALMFGDTQPRDMTEVFYIGRDVVRELIGAPAAFGVVLGDVLFDDLKPVPRAHAHDGANRRAHLLCAGQPRHQLRFAR
jgi:hypothetical protein